MPGQIVLKEKQAKIILAIREATQNMNISSVAKSTGTTYVHASTFLASCESRGIVKSEKHGKMKIYSLTERGQKLAEHISGIYLLVSQQKQPAQQEQNASVQ